MANYANVLLVVPLILFICSVRCASDDVPSFSHQSLGVFTERLGDYFPKSVTIPTVLVLPMHELEALEITESDFLLSYCPKPPNRLAFRGNEDELKRCVSETGEGKIQRWMAPYECANCASFRTFVEEIRNEVMRPVIRKKRFVPVLIAGTVALGAALGWLETNWRMNGLEQRLQVIADEVDRSGTSVINLEKGMVAVLNVTKNIHADVALVSRSLLEFQRYVVNNFSLVDAKLDSLQLEARKNEEYNIRMNFWRSFQLNYRFAKHRHDAYMNAALTAMVGRTLDISILDTLELWNKLQTVRKQLDDHLHYACSFGENVVEAVASAEVQHVMMDQNGSIVLIMTLSAFAPEKYELLSLKTYPFPIVGEDEKIVSYKKIQLSTNEIAVSKELPLHYAIPGHLKQIIANRFIDRRPDAQIVYSKNPSCESAIAFEDEENIHLCLLLIEEARIVRPKYLITDTLWYFTGTSKQIIERCPNQPRNIIITKPLTILQPKCGCTYIDHHEASGQAYFNDRDICDVTPIHLETYKISNPAISKDELRKALALLLQSSSFNVPVKYNVTWISDLSKIARDETNVDDRLAQLIREHTIQRQQDIDSLAEFRRKTVFDGNEHYLALACGILFLMVIILIFVLLCHCRKTKKMSERFSNFAFNKN